MPILAVLLAAAPVPPPEPAQIEHAIWYDLLANMMIRNGDRTAGAWFQDAGDRPEDDAARPDMRIRDLNCSPGASVYRCRFTLVRVGGPAVFRGHPSPERVMCRARLVSDHEGWQVEHVPPRGRDGHSRSTMRCRAGRH